MATPGRKPKHDRAAIIRQICARIAEGELVKDVCADLKISAGQVREWVAENAGLAALYARAREDQAHAIAEQAISVANGDDALTLLRQDAIDDAETELRASDAKNWYQKVRALRAEVVNRDKLRVDALKWMASKIAPRHYGERQQIVGDGGGPVQVEHVWRVAGRELRF